VTTLTPRYLRIRPWCAFSGMSRSATYEALGDGRLKAVKLGTATLIDVEPISPRCPLRKSDLVTGGLPRRLPSERA